MTQSAVRFLHASDFHLERPLYGLTKIPDRLRDLFVEAPYQAAEQVFETALAEGVDALLLAGDILDIGRAGPKGLVFLMEQFERLADRQVPVYWAGGAIDSPTSWPPSVGLPANVHVFPAGAVSDYELRHDDAVVARIQGTSLSGSVPLDMRGFHSDAHGAFTVGVAHGTNDSAGTEGDRVDYMALGGRHSRQTVDYEPGVAHYSGSPQGRCPRESGPHGCTLIQVDETRKAKTSFIAMDSVRWLDEVVEITASTKSEQLVERMEDRLEKLLVKHQGLELMVTWQIRGAGSLVHRLREGGLGGEILTTLRRKYGEGNRVAYSVSIESDSPLSVPPSWYDQETVMGDLLRQFKTYHEEKELPLELERFLPEHDRQGPLAGLAKIRHSRERDALLLQAEKLGVDLLDVPIDEVLDEAD